MRQQVANTTEDIGWARQANYELNGPNAKAGSGFRERFGTEKL